MYQIDNRQEQNNGDESVKCEYECNDGAGDADNDLDALMMMMTTMMMLTEMMMMMMILLMMILMMTTMMMMNTEIAVSFPFPTVGTGSDCVV